MKYAEIEMNGTQKKLAKICLGTARFGARLEEEIAFEMMDKYMEYGGNFIDTARNYDEWKEDGRGSSERCIGKWMNQRNNRNEIIVCTKGGVKRNDTGARVYDLSKKYLKEEIKESLEALETDYIDIYLLHKDEKERPVEEIMDTMQELVEEAKISKIGVANWSIDRIITANDYAKKNNLKQIEIVQTWWSLAEYTKEMWNDEATTWMTKDLYEYMKDNDMLGMAYTPQCKGFFQKAINQGIEFVDDFLRKRIVTKRNLEKLDYIKQFCEKSNISPTAFVNGYITCNPLNGISIVSCSKLAQLQDILDWCNYEMDIKVINEIDDI